MANLKTRPKAKKQRPSRAICALIGKSLGRDRRIDKDGNDKGIQLIDEKGKKVAHEAALEIVVPALQEHLEWCIKAVDEVVLELLAPPPNAIVDAGLICRANQMKGVAIRLRQEIHGMTGKNYNKGHVRVWWQQHFDEHNEPIPNDDATGGEEVLGTIFDKLKDKLKDETQKRRQWCETGHVTGDASGSNAPDPSDVLPPPAAEYPLLMTADLDENLLAERDENLLAILPDSDEVSVVLNASYFAMELAHTLASGALPPLAHAMSDPRSDATPVAAAPSPAHLGVALGVASEPAESPC